jgi:hypothetical protein
MKVRKIAVTTAILAAVGGTGAATAVAAQPATTAAPATQSQLREYEGRIVSVNRSARTFRLRDSERGTITVKVNRNTRFERLAGFSGLRAGQNRIEVQVRRSNGAWLAREVERSGGGGQHGGGSDDRGGDDNGGGRGRDHAEDD